MVEIGKLISEEKVFNNIMILYMYTKFWLQLIAFASSIIYCKF